MTNAEILGVLEREVDTDKVFNRFIPAILEVNLNLFSNINVLISKDFTEVLLGSDGGETYRQDLSSNKFYTTSILIYDKWYARYEPNAHIIGVLKQMFEGKFVELSQLDKYKLIDFSGYPFTEGVQMSIILEVLWVDSRAREALATEYGMLGTELPLNLLSKYKGVGNIYIEDNI